MSTSGTVTFSVTEADVIRDALETIGYIDPEEAAIDGALLVSARRKLNMIVKQWTAQLDSAPGLKMWTRRKAYLFLQDAQTVYNLGPSGDHASENYVSTTLSAGAANGAGSVVLTSATGISSGDYIGVLLDSGAIHWTTVNGAPAGSTVTLTAVLTSAASSGARVFAYTTKMRRPFALEAASLRDTDGNDSEVDFSLNLQDYESIPSKSAQGTPCRLYFEAQRTNARAYIDCAPEDCTRVIRLSYLSYVEDFAAQTDDADFPAEWARPLSLQLALDCCLIFGRPVPVGLPELLKDALTMARKAYPETSTLCYQSDPDDY